MNENQEKQTMWLSATPMNLNKRTNEKSRKIDRSISDESVQEIGQMLWQTILRKQIIKLSKFICGNPRISTPIDGSTSKKRHNVIKRRKLCVRIHRLLYQKNTKSRSHYLTGNNKLFTPYPSFHIVNVGIIRVDKEVWIKLSNQSNQRGMLNIQKR